MTYSQTREHIADEAARLLYEEAYRDYHLAKQKAVEHFSDTGTRAKKSDQPSNLEIYNALLSRSSMYADEESQQHLNELRKVAIEAMGFLQNYSPRLTGSVMDGTAGEYSQISLHLFADTPEEIMFFLEDNKIPFQTHERKITIRNKQETAPLLRFYVDDFEMELLLLDEGCIRTPPLSMITGKATKSMSIEEVKKLVTTQPTP